MWYEADVYAGVAASVAERLRIGARCGFAPGTRVWFQFGVLDGAAAFGVAASHGLRGVTP